MLKFDGFVKCSNNKVLAEEHAFFDCKGNPHFDEETRNKADVTIVTDILESLDKWVVEYTTTNTDYPDGAIHIVDEVRNRWIDAVKEWLAVDYGRYDVAELICENLNGEFDCEPEYDPNEYNTYSGGGCCLYSLDIGDYEEQVDISQFAELQELHYQHRLDDVLDEVNCDVYVCRSKKRVRNETTGYYEEVGRRTYDNSKHPILTTIHSISGQWHYVVPNERMQELLTEAIIELCRQLDSNKEC